MEPIPYSRQSIIKEDIREVSKVLSSDWLTQGPKIREFEDALSAYTGARYAVAVSSGTAALHLAMLALGVEKGDETITSPITFAASASCALYVGARPRFVDIDDDTYQMDIESLKGYLKAPSRRKRVKAVLPVHFMGTVADIVGIKRICDKYGIRIVEDAAHALGAKYKIKSAKGKWIKVGGSTHSDITIFSFHPIKHITTGEGGAILTNNKKIYQKALRLRHHGIIKRRSGLRLWYYDIPQPGFNYRITDFQCALGLSQLKRLDAIVMKRRGLADAYNKGLSAAKEIRLPREREDTRSSYHLYVIRVPAPKRDGLYVHLRRNGIATQVNYIPVHLFSYYRKAFGYRQGDFPAAERYFEECLSLPLYATLSEAEQIKIVDRIKRFFKYE